MKTILGTVRRVAKSEDGVTAIEYALIAALIAVLVIGGAQVVGTNLDTIFNDVAGDLQNAQGGGGGP